MQSVLIPAEAINPNAYMFESMYLYLLQTGQELVIRDAKVRELEDVMLRFDPAYPVITSFKARNLSLTYCKKEMLWYLGADPYDNSIEQHATMWKKLSQPDGSYFSNYGQYIFDRSKTPSQFKYVVEELQRDMYSRRAAIVLLQPHHLFGDNVDTVCTYAINFRIRQNRLNMTVMMRSNDAIFGTTNDAFCFWVIYKMMFAMLNDCYPTLKMGSYRHIVNSLHVYERHYEMLDQLVKDGQSGWYDIEVPELSADEAIQMLNHRPNVPVGPFTEWLHSETVS